jgi:hypothetical protein
MMYRLNSDVCRDIKQYSMNKTGSNGLTYFINCPKNGTMVAPFNSSFFMLKGGVNALNAAQKAANLLSKDMGSVEVFGALDAAPTPKQGVFIKALTVVVKKDVDAIRTQITYQKESGNLSTGAEKVVTEAITSVTGWSSAVTKSSEMARCMFITEFFAEADKTICDPTPKGGLYGCVEICFSMGIVMMLGLFLGILGAVRFDEQNGDGFKLRISRTSTMPSWFLSVLWAVFSCSHRYPLPLNLSRFSTTTNTHHTKTHKHTSYSPHITQNAGRACKNLTHHLVCWIFFFTGGCAAYSSYSHCLSSSSINRVAPIRTIPRLPPSLPLRTRRTECPTCPTPWSTRLARSRKWLSLYLWPLRWHQWGFM